MTTSLSSVVRENFHDSKQFENVLKLSNFGEFQSLEIISVVISAFANLQLKCFDFNKITRI